MTHASTVLSPMEAYEQIMRFAAQRGESTLRLAFHAALPQVLRPGLLHLLRLNFVPESIDDPAAESDVLFAPFCEDLGNEYYCFDRNARLQLLMHLDPAYEGDAVFRSRQVARFLLAYFDQEANNLSLSSDLVYNAYLEVERWVALAFFDEETAAIQLANAVKQSCESGEVAARIRIGGLASALSTPLAQHQKLLAYAAGVEALESGAPGRAQELLESLGDNEIQVGGVILPSLRSVLNERLQQIKESRPRERDEGLERKKEKETVESEGQEQRVEGPKERPARDQIFISYSHRDERWAKELITHFKPVAAHNINIWSDLKIRPGAAWRTEIQQAIKRARVAILLVSVDYLASDFCMDALLKLQEEAVQGEMRLTWVCVHDCLWRETQVANYQAVYDPRKPLSTLRRDQRQRALAQIGDAIAKLLQPTKAEAEAEILQPHLPETESEVAKEAVPPETRRWRRRLYVSSTYSDLAEHRRAVYDALLELGHEVFPADWAATDERTLEKALNDLVTCDAVVCIVAWRYGSIPLIPYNPTGLSIVELEYREARKLGKPVFPFVLDPNSSWPTSYMDDGDKGERVRRFRDELINERLVSLFRTPKELASLAVAALASSIPEPGLKTANREHLRRIRVFVSSPGDVRAERDLLDGVVDEINRTMGDAGSFVLQLFKWERNVIPQIDQTPQGVIDNQMPDCDVYLGILRTRFGTPTGNYGSGTEQEFRAALERFNSQGRPWISFYFYNGPVELRSREEREQYDKVCEFRDELERKGVVGRYKKTRGSRDAFVEQVRTNLTKLVRQFTDESEKADTLKDEITEGAPSPSVVESTIDTHAMTDIFISYAEEDREVARKISQLFEDGGWSVWWDRKIPAGKTWRNVLEEAMQNMRCMVVLWSANSIASEWVKEEAEEGKSQGKLVPILIESVKPPMGFLTIQAADLIGWNGNKDSPAFQRLLADMTEIIQQSREADKLKNEVPTE
jgi:TIR domain/Domain of unknown function (DUF4062)